MIDIGIGGKADIQKIHRVVRNDEVLIGYPDGIAHPGVAMQNSDLARALHHGTAKIPARPWLYQTIASVRTELQRKIREMHKRSISENREPAGEFSLEGIGAFVVGAVQTFIRSGYYKSAVPNAPETIARKGADTPLIGTGKPDSHGRPYSASPGFLVNSTTFVTRKHPPKLVERAIEVGEQK